jgi:hypothetical protein
MKSLGHMLLVVVLLLLLPPGVRAQGPGRLTQVVEQAEPALTWAAPQSIGYGQALDATELNASSPVAGTFVYTPGAGAILAAGQQTLSVQLQPTDPNYKAASAQVPLTVRSALGATFQLDSWRPPNGEVLWAPGDTVTVWLTPVGDFHQPIQLRCAATGGYSCTLDQSVVRPVGVAAPVRVTMSRDNGQNPMPVRVPGGSVPAVFVLGLVFGRRKLRGLVLCAAAFAVMSGCGATRSGVATITATSLLETKQMTIHIVDSR